MRRCQYLLPWDKIQLSHLLDFFLSPLMNSSLRTDEFLTRSLILWMAVSVSSHSASLEGPHGTRVARHGVHGRHERKCGDQKCAGRRRHCRQFGRR